MAAGAAPPPDFLEPRVGWRVWDVVEVEGAFRLSSLLYRTIWLPGEETAARCRRALAALPWARMPLHAPPGRDCVCGIYAVATAAQALPYLGCALGRREPASCRVIGRVLLWGRVVEGRRGWRGTFAYPEHLLVPTQGRRRLLSVRGPRPSATEILVSLAEYGVSVELVEDGAGPRPRRRSPPPWLGLGPREEGELAPPSYR